MGSRGLEDEGGRAMNAWIREVPMREMADQLGIDELPMRQPDFDFFSHGVFQLSRMGFRGQNLDHAAREVMQILFFNIGKAKQIPIYEYVGWYEDHIAEGKKPQPFDDYFKWAFKQKANTQLRMEIKRKKKRGLSIEYGRGEDEGSLGEEFLEDTGPSPDEIYAEQEERERREQAFKEIPKMLTDLRLGDKYYITVWRMMKRNYTLQEMADRLNAMGVPTARGGEWGTGGVHKVRNQVYGIVKRFLEQRGIDPGSIIASRKKGFRFGLVLDGRVG